MTNTEVELRLITGFPATGRDAELYAYVTSLSGYNYQGEDLTGEQVLQIYSRHRATQKAPPPPIGTPAPPPPPTHEEIRAAEEAQQSLEKRRRAVSLESAEQAVDYYEARLAYLDMTTATEAQIEVAKFNVYGSKDYLEGLQRNPGQRLRDKDCDILLAFKAWPGYPAKGNPYYWNKKGQPKLRKLRARLNMKISKWERDSLFKMDD